MIHETPIPRLFLLVVDVAHIQYLSISSSAIQFALHSCSYAAHSILLFPINLLLFLLLLYPYKYIFECLLTNQIHKAMSIRDIQIAESSCGIEEAKCALILPQSSNFSANPNPEDLLCPPTPDLKHHNSGSISSDEENPQTPKESVFDSFAPGPDKLMLAPLRTKCTEESGASVVRRLNFCGAGNLFGDVTHDELTTSDDEDALFQIVYSSILDAIVTEQRKEIVLDDSDGFMTPKSAPRLSWVAETCPGAPVKSFSKYRGKIDNELCRKLEF